MSDEELIEQSGGFWVDDEFRINCRDLVALMEAARRTVSGQECADAVLEKLQELTMAAVEMRDTVEAFYANQERADAGKDAALLEALRKIAAIENKMYGGDWDEIEEARSIASIAILAANKEPK